MKELGGKPSKKAAKSSVGLLGTEVPRPAAHAPKGARREQACNDPEPARTIQEERLKVAYQPRIARIAAEALLSAFAQHLPLCEPTRRLLKDSKEAVADGLLLGQVEDEVARANEQPDQQRKKPWHCGEERVLRVEARVERQSDRDDEVERTDSEVQHQMLENVLAREKLRRRLTAKASPLVEQRVAVDLITGDGEHERPPHVIEPWRAVHGQYGVGERTGARREAAATAVGWHVACSGSARFVVHRPLRRRAEHWGSDIRIRRIHTNKVYIDLVP
eukprot:2393808-Prymnesium_polylepis.1